MYNVVIYNMESDEKIQEIVGSEKEIDILVESMHSIFGDFLSIEIEKIQEAIVTTPYSDKPICPKCLDPEFYGICNLCGQNNNDVEFNLYVPMNM